MSTGHIRDFTKPNPLPKTTAPIKRMSTITGVENEVEIHLHEQVIVQGEDKIRQPGKQEGDPDVRLRVTDMKSWQKVLDDEEDDD